MNGSGRKPGIARKKWLRGGGVRKRGACETYVPGSVSGYLTDLGKTCCPKSKKATGVILLSWAKSCGRENQKDQKPKNHRGKKNRGGRKKALYIEGDMRTGGRGKKK